MVKRGVIVVEPASALDLALTSIAQAMPVYIQKIQVLVGGIFGLYLIFLIIRYFHDKKQLKLLKDIKLEIANLNHNLFADEQELNKTNVHKLPFNRLRKKRKKHMHKRHKTHK